MYGPVLPDSDICIWHMPIEVFHGGHVCGQLQSTDTKYAFINEGGTPKLTTNMGAVKNLYSGYTKKYFIN